MPDFVNALKIVDLPTLGNPTIPTCKAISKITAIYQCSTLLKINNFSPNSSFKF